MKKLSNEEYELLEWLYKHSNESRRKQIQSNNKDVSQEYWDELSRKYPR